MCACLLDCKILEERVEIQERIDQCYPSPVSVLLLRGYLTPDVVNLLGLLTLGVYFFGLLVLGNEEGLIQNSDGGCFLALVTLRSDVAA